MKATAILKLREAGFINEAQQHAIVEHFKLEREGNRFLPIVGIIGWEEQIPANKHHAFAADLWAHSASYLFGFVGGLGLAIRTWWRRWRHARETSQPA